MKVNEPLTDEVRELRRRYTELLFRGCFRENVQGAVTGSADELLDSLVPGPEPGTYLWRDLDYADRSRSGVWQAAKHTHRLEAAIVRCGRERLHDDGAAREKLLGALRFWLIRDFQNPNWWHNEIGTPALLGDIGLLLWEYLSGEETEQLLRLVSRGSVGSRPELLRRSGANLIWEILNSVRHALLSGDAALLRVCRDCAEKEMEVSGEGIQPDGSFYQHGPRWYSGGYGASFTFELSRLVWLFRGTSFGFPDERLAVFLRHVLDGQRRMMLHGYFDYAGVGREITRRGALRPAELIAGVRLLAEIGDLPRRAEVLGFVRDIDRGAAAEETDPYSGAAWYPGISFLAHRQRGAYFGIKCLTDTQYGAEVCNSEGALCYNMSYGTHTCLMRRGDEYYDLNPIYDWAHVPGTTARQESDAELLVHRDWWRLPLPNGHTGGMTEGGRGIVFEKPEHDGISLAASFFVFDGCMAALGAGIRDEKADGKPLTTTLDQCRPVLPEIGNGRVSNGGFTYENLDPGTELRAEVVRRTGSWRRNSFEETDEKVTGEVFLAEIPVTPGRDCYAYAVSPRGTDAGVRILSNTAALQAIALPDGTVMAVFHEAGELAVPGAAPLYGAAGTCAIRARADAGTLPEEKR